MKTVYQVLFEMRLLHEFYLTDRVGKNIFDFPAQADRLNFLKQRFENGDENIEGEIAFEVPEKAKLLFDNFHLKLIPCYAGFKVAVQVVPQKLPGGTVVYEPKCTLPDDLCISVLAVRKSQRLDGFTSSKMEMTIPATYYFSNENTVTGPRIFPFLSADIAAFDAGTAYAQGELAKFGPGDYREFYRDDADAIQWISLSGKAFANENDRMLLPLNFCYVFPKSSSVNKADFLLKDKNGNTVGKYQFKGNQPFRKVQLSVDPKKVLQVPAAAISDQMIYSLKVSGNGGYNKTHKLLFYQNEQEIRNSLALIVMKVKTAVPAYNLTDNLGRLITRKQADQTVNPLPPVFELNFKSKPCFWRYINNRRKNLKAGLHPDFLLSKNGLLITRQPRSLTCNATLFRKPDNSLYYLPNPQPYQSLTFENNKLYSDILVQESSLFPLAP